MEKEIYTAKYNTFEEIQDKYKANSRATIVDGLLKMDWCYGGFTIEGYFSGDIVLVELDPGNIEDSKKMSYCMINDDFENRKEIVVTGKGDYVIAKDLKPDFYRVEFFKASESTIFKIKGIKYTGELSEKPLEKEKRINIIGDSITCGSALLSQAENIEKSEHFYDVSHSYAVKVARHFGAEFGIFSRSGATCGTEGKYDPPRMNEKYFDTFLWGTDKFDFTRERNPDLVIITLGTNDTPYYIPKEEGGEDSKDKKILVNCITQMLSVVRKQHPDAKILWVYGYADTRLSEIYETTVKAFIEKDGNTYYTFAPCSDLSGANGHATPKGHDSIAKQVIKFIEENKLI